MRIRKILIPLLALALVLCCATAFAANDMTFETTAYSIFEGETVQLSLIRQAGALEDGTLTFASSSTKIATVDESGLVTARSKGTATITATLKTEAKKYTASVKVSVLRAVTSLEVNTSKLTVYKSPDDPALDGLLTKYDTDADQPVLVLSVGTNVTINATLLPKDASNRKFTVTTDDPDEKAVKVISNGTGLKPVAPGECMVTVSSISNPEVTEVYHVLVIQPVKSIKLTCDAEKNTIDVGGTTLVTAAFTPDDVTFTGLVWSSNNEKVATVDQNGIVTGVGKGSANITAKSAADNRKTASIRINVQQQPTSITLNPENPTIAVGSPRTMKATVLPSNANDKAVTWSSSDSSVATVASNGKITPVAPGECTITCTATNHPEVSAETIISVIQPATKITFDQSSASVIVGETTSVSYTIYPDYTTDQSVTFRSNNTKIASVDANGTITGIKAGTATITVTTADGSNKRANVKVTVIQPVEGVHMKNETANVGVDESVTLTAVLEPSDASNTYMTWVSDDESVATVRGNRTRPVVTGKSWGEVTVTGTTEDGGYTTSCTVKVGNYDKALELSDVYVDGNNEIRLNVTNLSNMNITRFYMTITVYDLYGQPLPCTTTGNNEFEATYAETLDAGMSTRHNRFTFRSFVQPDDIIGQIVVNITGYQAEDGFSRTIAEEKQPSLSWTSSNYNPGGQVDPS